MKILAIRGKNLASLAGPFEVDFEEEPLRSSGLFAITGPTGAGKSTLLDALCLALFDATPRLAERGGPAIGRPDEADRLTANDVRSLMTRGAAEAGAEVDFVGRDGLRWRAAWSVTRARGRKEGRVQKQELVLTDLATGRPAGGTKTETLAAIEERLGLSFEQFRKSVLLAQGEFADFLKAGKDERSLLLQRLTGAGVYEAVSRQAHLKAKEAGARQQHLAGLRSAVTVLPDEARAALDAEVAAAEAGVVRQDGRVRLLEELSRLAARASEAGTDARGREAEAARCRGAVATAEAGREESARALAAAAAALETLKQQQEAARPAVGEARELDVKLAAASRAHEEAEQGAAEAVSRLEAARAAVEAGERTEARLGGDLSGLEAWLAGHASSKEVAGLWDQVEARLHDLEALAGGKARAAAEEREAGAALAAASAEAGKAASALEEAATRLAEANGRLARAQERLDTIPLAASRARLEALAAVDRQLVVLAEVRRRAIAAEAGRLEHVANAARAGRRAAEARASEAAASRRLAELELVLPEAKRALALGEGSVALEDRRADLADGQPCPLCGALDHPWARTGAPAAGAVAEQRRRVRELEAEEKGEVGRLRAAAATLQAEAGVLATERGRAAERERDLEELAATWAGGAAALGAPGEPLPASPLDGAAGPLLAAREAGVRAETGSLRTVVQEAERVEAEARRLGRQRDDLAERQEKARTRRERSDAAVHEAERRRDAAAAALSAQSVAAEREVRQLGPLLAGWPELSGLLAERPRHVRDVLAGEAAAYRTKAAEAEAVRSGLEAAARAAAAARSALVPREEQAAASRAEAARKGEALGALRAARAPLLGGRSVADVEREQRTRLRDAEQALERARLQEAAAASAAVASRAAASAAGSRASEARGAASDLDARLDAERTRLDVPPGDDAIATTVAAARAVLGDLRSAAEARRSDRGRDGEARARAAALDAELAAHEADTKVWLELDGLVGSADGKKFRNFVQSLTLDALVKATNHHLRDLSRRYRLERIPRSDMDLQVVDSVLGDDRRSVQSLSGGETFLVSLALALGLSSLATQRTRVETLFVDEGFGSLDGDTLEKALAVLEALQATGRRVGVISHVTTMSDRIGVRVQVERKGGGRSAVRVVGG